MSHPQLLLAPEELAQILQNAEQTSSIRIVDLSSEANFMAGHIPGAHHLSFQELMAGTPPAPGKLPDKSRLTHLFNSLGLQKDTHFIVVDDEGGGWAGRFIWTLDVIGHTHYSYVDGGMIAWKAAELPLEKGPAQAKINSGTIHEVEIHRDPIADIDHIMQNINTQAITIWDARSPAEYQGMKALAAKAGHIPGAINAEWTSLMDQHNDYRIRRDAKEYLAKLGIDGSRPIVTHCQSHHRSAFTYLVGKILGLPIKGYDGSWAEWGNHPDTPVEQ